MLFKEVMAANLESSGIEVAHKGSYKINNYFWQGVGWSGHVRNFLDNRHSSFKAVFADSGVIVPMPHADVSMDLLDNTSGSIPH